MYKKIWWKSKDIVSLEILSFTADKMIKKENSSVVFYEFF